MYSSGRKRHRNSQWNNKTDSETQSATPENLRIEIDQIFKEFIANAEAKEYVFTSDLNNLQRKYIHDKAKTLNIISRSYGREPDRRLHLRKKTQQVNMQSFYVTPSLEAEELFTAFFMDHPHPEPIQRLKKIQFTDKVFGKIMEGAPVLVPEPNVSEDMANFKRMLPIYDVKDEIVKTIMNHQVTIVSSETGSGKTTQIPQYLMDYSRINNQPCKIVCTQPRRIATVAIAERVADERGELLGTTVGYHIRLEQKYGLNTNLIYCTNGVMLRTLMSGDQVLQNLTHLIIDEVHERDRLSDFLLICLKQFLQNHPALKVVLMSATVNIEKFQNYFGNAAVLTIPGRLFPIQDYLLDEILIMIPYVSSAMRKMYNDFRPNNNVEPNNEDNSNNLHVDAALDTYMSCTGDLTDSASQLLMLFTSENIPVNYQHSQNGITALMVAAYHGDINTVSILCNLGADPHLACNMGKSALDYARDHSQFNTVQLLEYISEELPARTLTQNPTDLLTLYDKTTNDEEIDFDLLLSLICHIHCKEPEGSILVFLPGYDDIMICHDRIQDSCLRRQTYKVFFLHSSMNVREQHEIFKRIPNKRKIILSTNIAETSITIDDVVYVIDCGKAKEKSFDSYNKLSSLTTQWISKACVKQRAGRAGRTAPGKCYHLFSRQRLFNMEQERIPEILRVSLEELCLHTKILAPRNMDIYSFLAQAPDPPSSNAVKAAVESLQSLGAMDISENLTVLGEYLGQLTIEPHLGKMLIYSVIFKCLEPILTLTAAMSHKDPFQLPAQANLRTRAAEKRKALTEGVLSDHIIFLTAFKKWQNDTHIGRGHEFCKEFFISKSAMDGILETRRQLLGQLRAAGFIPQANSIEAFNTYANSWPMVKAVICSGLYPRVAYPVFGGYNTRSEKKLYVHNTSVLNKSNSNAWLVYDELVKNRTSFYIRGLTAITPITLAFICGNNTESIAPNLLTIDEWLDFEFQNNHIIQFREFVKNIVRKSLKNPINGPTSEDIQTLQTMDKILNIEESQAGFIQPVGIGDRPKFFYKLVEQGSRNRPNYSLRGILTNEIDKFKNGGRHSRQQQNSYPRRNMGPRNNNTNVEPKPSPSVPFRATDHSDVESLNVAFHNNFRVRHQDDGHQANGLNLAVGSKVDKSHNYSDNPIYLLVKPQQIKSVQIAYNSSYWVFAPQTEKKIQSLRSKGKRIVLIFTVPNSYAFHGIANFVSFDIPNSAGKIRGKLEWLFQRELNYNIIRHIRNVYNNHRPIYEGLDGQVIEQGAAEELIRIYQECSVVARPPQRNFNN